MAKQVQLITVNSDSGTFLFTVKEFSRQVENVKKGIDFDLSKAKSKTGDTQDLNDIYDTFWPRG